MEERKLELHANCNVQSLSSVITVSQNPMSFFLDVCACLHAEKVPCALAIVSSVWMVCHYTTQTTVMLSACWPNVARKPCSKLSTM